MESIGSKRNFTYTKRSDKDRYLIGKYISENGVAAAVRKFKKKFPDLNKSTVRSFRKKVEAELKKASKEKREPSKVTVKYSSPTGHPLMLGQLDPMVQTYLIAQSQYKYRKCNCSCIDSKIFSSCRKYFFGVNSLRSQSFQTEGIRKASKNFIKSQKP